MINRIKYLLKTYFLEIFLLFIFLLFAFWLMFHSFSYEEGSILIGDKLRSDFISHIAVIRSFSLGSNFPPEYALFPGEPMRFHFLFYAFVGFLEKIGFRIDYALNIPSAIGFGALLLMIYLFAKKIFNSIAVGLISVLFFLFNGSLSFIYFFKEHSFNSNTIHDIITSNTFSSFGPYDEKLVSAFWNLNIYTNQRHLGLSYALSLLLIYTLISPLFSEKENVKKTKKMPHFISLIFGKELDLSTKYLIKTITLGLLLSFFFYLHLGVFTFTVLIILILGLLFTKLRMSVLIILLIGCIFSVPQYIYQTGGESTFQVLINPGFLITTGLSIQSFIEYWLYNLGLPLILLIAGFIISPTKNKKILIAFFSLFIIGNLFQFSPEIAGNHKFFNFFMIVGVMYASYFLFKVWNKNMIGKIIVLIAIFISTFSGILDFFPIYNDAKGTIPDYKINPVSSWIINNTEPDSVILNTHFIYNPASLVGRKIFLGWPYFAWSAGYDTNKRGEIMKNILGSNNKEGACRLLIENKISYVEIFNQNPPDPNIPPISSIYSDEFNYSYADLNGFKIYNVQENCK